ncbi:hypothetical protein PN441_10795 [Spirulina major CS-329]|uniref:hypothetical protein n=1 Tax=Spirulina TaxID=1154 RepID=UPI00232EBBB3|nr:MULTISPECIES: hypothetical protein [Spirulina]MDB9496395.1 hypothetical protein [Spirulina subsalsa CS-330]MDB9503558.1 hypothetical protein [Spirulina major CS-329]
MSILIAVHSFRHGIGKTTCLVNLAMMMAQNGHRTGIIDQPAEQSIQARFPADAATLDTLHLLEPLPSPLPNLERLSQHLNGYSTPSPLDYLWVELNSPLDQETLPILALCDMVLFVSGIDEHDFQQTAIAVDVARQLEVPQILLVINQAPHAISFHALSAQVQQIYRPDAIAILPWTAAMATLGPHETLCTHLTHHPIYQNLTTLSQAISTLSITATVTPLRLSFFDLLQLPDQHRTFLSWLIRQRSAPFHAVMDHMQMNPADTTQFINSLVQQGLITPKPHAQEIHYHPCFVMKSGRHTRKRSQSGLFDDLV